jgi:hypothetical protein
MPLLPAIENRRINEKVLKFTIKLGLHFMIPELVYKFQIIYSRETSVIVTEQKLKWDIRTSVKYIAPNIYR